jgi:hypothetical protein
MGSTFVNATMYPTQPNIKKNTHYKNRAGGVTQAIRVCLADKHAALSSNSSTTKKKKEKKKKKNALLGKS